MERAINIQRLPPHNIEAEQGLLGCIMLDYKLVLGELIPKIKSEEFWYDFRHLEIFRAMNDLYDASRPVDVISLQANLRSKSALASVGGVEMLIAIGSASPSAYNWTYYFELVNEAFIRRRIIKACFQTLESAYENTDIQETLDFAEKTILEAGQAAIGDQDESIREIVHRVIAGYEYSHQNQGSLHGLSTGLFDLDNLTGGLKPGEMFVIAARPSMGKTALAMNIAGHVAIDLKQPVGVFSLEMSKDSLVSRMLCANARVNERAIRRGTILEGDFPKLTMAASKLARSNLHLDDIGGITILQLRAKARRMKQRYGIKFLVIDYLQLLTGSSKRFEGRQNEVAEISRGIKAILKELQIPGLILAQLNRDIEKEKNRKPRLSDLRESGSIEQDADIVGMLYSKKDQNEIDDLTVYPIELVINKQRNGPTGEVPMTFFKQFTKFEARSKFSGDDIP